MVKPTQGHASTYTTLCVPSLNSALSWIICKVRSILVLTVFKNRIKRKSGKFQVFHKNRRDKGRIDNFLDCVHARAPLFTHRFSLLATRLITSRSHQTDLEERQRLVKNCNFWKAILVRTYAIRCPWLEAKYSGKFTFVGRSIWDGERAGFDACQRMWIRVFFLFSSFSGQLLSEKKTFFSADLKWTNCNACLVLFSGVWLKWLA